MRTYILSLVDLSTMQKIRYRCRASDFAQAIGMAEKAHPGFFTVLGSTAASEVEHASINA